MPALPIPLLNNYDSNVSRFTLKQQIGISRQAEAMRTLSSELKKSQELVQQLQKLLLKILLTVKSKVKVVQAV